MTQTPASPLSAPPAEPSPAPVNQDGQIPKPSRWQRFWKDATRKTLFVAGVFIFADLGSVTIHELGHALNLVATGGTVDYIQVTFGGESRVQTTSNPEPMATTWGGFLWQVMAPLLLLLGLWQVWPRLSFWALALLIACFLNAGHYLYTHATWDCRDPHFLMVGGVSKTALQAIGCCLLALSIPAIPLAAALGGVGFRRCPWRTTILAVGIPALLFWTSQKIATGFFEPLALAWYNLLALAVFLLIGLVGVTLVHFLAGLFRWEAIRRREVRPSWWNTGLALALAGGMIALVLTVFRTRPETPGQVLLGEIINRSNDFSEPVQNGADINGEPGKVPPLFAAIHTRNEAAVRWLLDHRAPVTRYYLDGTALHLAAWVHGAEYAIPMLLQQGADVNAIDDQGRTPLHLAAEYGSREAVRLLLSHGATITSDNNGSTPLHKAGSVETAVLLLDAGATVDQPGLCGKTPLILAASRGQTKLVDVLLSRGADRNARDRRGNTALHWAAAYGHEATVRFLLAARANPTVRNALGETPLDRARRFQEAATVALLQPVTATSSPASAPASSTRP